MNSEGSVPQHVHFVGIGGIGMSAIAKVLLERGYRVSGSDLHLSPLTERLEELGAVVWEGHRAQHVGAAELVVVSSAVPPDNPEIIEARRRGVPVVKRAEVLGWLMATRYGIAVAGTHGKTTTSAMIALTLEDAGLAPTILVGGELVDLGTNARWGNGTYLVAEADEFDGSFLRLSPRLAVVTNIEADHLDCYGSFDAVVDAFQRFLARVPSDGHVVACVDDPTLRRVAQGGQAGTHPGPQWVTYGLKTATAQWRAVDLRLNDLGGYDFCAWNGDELVGEFRLRVPGQHNVSNCLATLAATSILGVDAETARTTLARFQGTRRRFEIKGTVRGVVVVDDYAHHPTEIQATLTAARERFAGRSLWVVFQPHTYSRTKFLLEEFATAFDQADHVVVTDIYAAREHNDLGVHAAQLVARMRHPDTCYIPDLDSAASYVADRLGQDDVLFTVGAGDVWRVGEMVLSAMEADQT